MHFITKRYRIAEFAPNYRDVVETFGAIIEVVENINAQLKAAKQSPAFELDKTHHKIYYNAVDNNGVPYTKKHRPCIEFFGLKDWGKKDEGRGQLYDIVLYEETQKIPSAVLEHHFEKVAVPTLTDRDGRAYLFGTPADSKNHYFHKMAAIGARNHPALQNSKDLQRDDIEPHDSFITFRMPTHTNPHINPTVIQAAKRLLPYHAYQMEYLAVYADVSTNLWCSALENPIINDRVFVDNLTNEYSKRGLKLCLTFDFNRNPMACLLVLFDQQRGIIEVVQEFGAANDEKVTIYDICAQIRKYFAHAYGQKIGLWNGEQQGIKNLPLYVTGDATGRAGSGLNKENRNWFDEIRNELGIPQSRIKTRRINPTHAESWQQMELYLYRFAQLRIDKTRAKRLVADMQQTEMTDGRKINKEAYDPHYLDAFRYFLYTFFDPRPKKHHVLEVFHQIEN